ncbi:ABC transporter ATP-binding protein [Magnetofaba australis]|uniref:Putative ABC transporter related protein n=1 Tax=Magnetofaba australis IT-1 TaxID=1434232 RepID=A0A1Y2K528_9PROT|nr:ATP-binding cassette domain-containing protein [Magnetofaba australis]OSM04359.1 putative ABC transporter related protein [Magnetofaba australis IT-1]
MNSEVALKERGLRVVSLTVATGLNYAFAVAPGETLAVMGPSGSGKSLLLRAIADLDPHDGDIHLHADAQQGIAAHLWRRQVGYLPAESAWWDDTVGAHLPENLDATALKGWLQALKLSEECLEWRVDRLSSGEKQRLSLLRLLAGSPGALLLDEPTANLDPETTEQVEKLLLARIEEDDLPAIWVTHHEAQAKRVAKRMLRITKEKQVEEVTL